MELLLWLLFIVVPVYLIMPVVNGGRVALMMGMVLMVVVVVVVEEEEVIEKKEAIAVKAWLECRPHRKCHILLRQKMMKKLSFILFFSLSWEDESLKSKRRKVWASLKVGWLFLLFFPFRFGNVANSFSQRRWAVSKHVWWVCLWRFQSACSYYRRTHLLPLCPKYIFICKKLSSKVTPCFFFHWDPGNFYLLLSSRRSKTGNRLYRISCASSQTELWDNLTEIWEMRASRWNSEALDAQASNVLLCSLPKTFLPHKLFLYHRIKRLLLANSLCWGP